MFMHSARLAAMERHLRGPDADLGTLRSAQVAFCFNAPAEFLSTDIRLQPSLEPAGAIGDLGHYCIRFALFAFGWDRAPAAVSATLHATAGGGTPSAATATLVWAPIDSDGGVPPVCVRVMWAGFSGAAGCVWGRTGSARGMRALPLRSCGRGQRYSASPQSRSLLPHYRLICGSRGFRLLIQKRPINAVILTPPPHAARR